MRAPTDTDRRKMRFWVCPEQEAGFTALGTKLHLRDAHLAPLAVAMILLYLPSVDGNHKQLMWDEVCRFHDALLRRAAKAEEKRIAALARTKVPGFVAGLDELLSRTQER